MSWDQFEGIQARADADHALEEAVKAADKAQRLSLASATVMAAAIYGDRHPELLDRIEAHYGEPVTQDTLLEAAYATLEKAEQERAISRSLADRSNILHGS